MISRDDFDVFEKYFRKTKDYRFYFEHELKDKEIFKRSKTKYLINCVQKHRETWQAAKASIYGASS